MIVGSNELTISFISSARKYGEYLNDADSKSANKQHSVMTKIMKSLMQDGLQGELLKYFNDPDPYVKLCIASYCIKHAPEECLKVLTALENSTGPASLTAGIIIDLWKTGRL